MRKTTKFATAIALMLFAIIFNSCQEDGSPPVITLNGDKNYTHYKGNTYVDPGATATDDVDGNITSRMTVTGTVGTAQGNYTKTYAVTDMAGNYTSESRYIAVKYANTTIAGTYSVTEIALGSSQTYTGTIVADTSDKITFTFSSTSGANPISATALVTSSLGSGINGSLQSTITSIQGGPISNFSGTIVSDTIPAVDVLKLELAYLRPINGTTTNCNATWIKQ